MGRKTEDIIAEEDGEKDIIREKLIITGQKDVRSNVMNIRRSALIIIVLALAIQSNACADKIYLKSGRILEGKIIDANKMGWNEPNDIIVWSDKNAPIVPRNDVLRVEKEFKKPEGIALLAKDDKWGEPNNGYVTQLIVQSEKYIVGKPMKFGLVIKGVSNVVRFYDKQGIVHNTLITKSADNNEAYYKEGPFQTAASKHVIDNGEIMTLFENRDITEEYVIIKPGKYTIQFRNGCYGDIDSCFPLSNIIEFEVKPGTPDERDILISSLVSVLPDTEWRAVTSNVEYRNTPPGRKKAEGIFISVWHPIPHSMGGVTATIWQTKTAAEIDEQIKNAQPCVYLGKNGSGYYYAEIPPKALEYWPKIKEDIVRALKIYK